MRQHQSKPPEIADANHALTCFIAAMENDGIVPAEPIAHALAGGTLVRFQVRGDRAGRRNGWAIFFENDRFAGAYGCHKRQITRKWLADAHPSNGMTNRQVVRTDQVAERLRAKRKQHTLTANEAQALWRTAAHPDGHHAYLVRKNIACEGMRQIGNRLIVPMVDIDGRIWNLQRIALDGTKRFLKGGRTEALMWRVGRPSGVICIGEGVGTMAAVRRATGHAVVAALSAKNLTAIARLIAKRWPDQAIIICADDDAHLVDNPHVGRNLGVEAALAAAAVVGARVAFPSRKGCNHG